LSKIRIYELAKELNTTSKRLMEKLAEINITVKNHMSYLEEHEVNALYDHIGVIRNNTDEKAEARNKNSGTQVKNEIKKDDKKETKNIPRIIRKTEIILDSDNTNKQNDQKNNNNQKFSFIKKTDNNSGLRPGFVRDTRPDYKRDVTSFASGKAKDDMSKKGTETEKDKAAVNAKNEINTVPDSDLNTVKGSAAANKKEAAGTAGNIDISSEQKEISSIKKSEKTNAEIINTGGKQNEERETEMKADAGNNLSEINMKKPDNETTEQAKEQNKQEIAEPAKKQTVEQSKESEEKQDKPGRNADGLKGEKTEVNMQSGKIDVKSDNKDGVKSDAASGEKDKSQEQNHDLNKQQQAQQKHKKHENEHKSSRQQNIKQDANLKEESLKDHANKAKHQDTNLKEKHQNDEHQNRKHDDGFARKQTGEKASDRSKPNYKQNQKILEIPKPEFSISQKEEGNSQRSESKRESQVWDVEKDDRREQRKEKVAVKGKKFNSQKIMLHQKKGISEILSEDFIFDEFYNDDGVKIKKSVKRKQEKNQKEKEGLKENQKVVPPKAVLTSITIPEVLTVKELAEALKKTAADVIKKLMSLGLMVTVNQEIDFETAAIVADEFGVKAEKQTVVNEEDILFDESEDNEADLEPRPPVVVVMGHVDHGKTSLLDAIRNTHVIDSEAGGITQHIGAYMVKINNRNITFLDTPGHEAFTAMRARGAQVTDIAILVVAADDGVMPQTVEAINHAKAANVSIIVAINKIDKPGANPERVKQELTEYGLVAEEWGGDVICVPVSAKKMQNIDTLLEMVLLTADLLELKANPNKQAKGTVIEAKLDKTKGAIATVLVQRGTLKVGDTIIAGTTLGRIRAMTDDRGNPVKKAGPSTPVEILGLSEVPEAGETFYVVNDEKTAKSLVEKRKLKQREQTIKAAPKVSLDDLFNQIQEGKVKELNIIIKADVQGSVEALKQSIEKLSNDEVRVKIIHGGVGAITETDVTFASVSNAIIIGFNVRPGNNVLEVAKNEKVDIRLYNVIYNAIEDIEAAMKGMLEPTFKENILGHAEIRQIFKISGIGTVAGCYVTDGKITRNSDVRVVRDGIVVYEGKLASLKRFKDDAREVLQGFECGLSIEKYNDIKEGDVIEAYVMEKVER